MTGSEGRSTRVACWAPAPTSWAVSNPRKAGTSVDFDLEPLGPGAQDLEAGTVSIPVFGTVAEAKEATGANVSVIFVPPAFTKNAVIEAVDADMDLVVIITEGVPVADSSRFYSYAAQKGVRLVGEHPGIITPGQSNVGITPADVHRPRAHWSGVEVWHTDLPDDVTNSRTSASPPAWASVAIPSLT